VFYIKGSSNLTVGLKISPVIQQTMSIVLIDTEVQEVVKTRERHIYHKLAIAHDDSLTDVQEELRKEMFAKYEITEEDTSLMKSRRYYLNNTVERFFDQMVADCKERLTNKERVLEQLAHLKKLVLPEQRSPEWFAMRNNVLTASSLADALGKGHFNTKESLLIDKTSKEKKPFFTNDIIQWGVKYEPIATAFYEHQHNLTIVEFGLVPHPTFSIFGASPDGICDTDSPQPMIGRMLEIKCPPRRNFTEEVPLHYWMQMQGQLETCDLEECDFLQVKLEEYQNTDAYQEDVLLEEGSVKEGYTSQGYPKGLVLTFMGSDADSNPTYSYEYCEMFASYEQCLAWRDDILKSYKERNIPYNACHENWWYIKRYECTLVLRDRRWWRETMPKIIDFWEDVENYRTVGNQALLDKRDARKQKRKITVDKKKKASPKSLNVIKINNQIVESLQTTNFLDTDSD
jgi:putative phage-type endonuclease